MEIVELLDQLAEFQSQADYLELEKRRLLDEVKVPDDVMAAQRAANKKRLEIDEAFQERQKIARDYAQYLVNDLIKPELPPEYLAAMEKYRLECERIMHQSDIDIQNDRSNVTQEWAKIDAELQAKTADIYAQVATRKVEISAEFDGKAVSVLDNIAKLTARIKNEVKAAKQTIKGKYFMAVYVKGRDGGWDTDKLTGYAAAHPEILPLKKPDGEPSVSLKKIA